MGEGIRKKAKLSEDVDESLIRRVGELAEWRGEDEGKKKRRCASDLSGGCTSNLIKK
jgi:hypothetical protein